MSMPRLTDCLAQRFVVDLCEIERMPSPLSGLLFAPPEPRWRWVPDACGYCGSSHFTDEQRADPFLAPLIKVYERTGVFPRLGGPPGMECRRVRILPCGGRLCAKPVFERLDR